MRVESCMDSIRALEKNVIFFLVSLCEFPRGIEGGYAEYSFQSILSAPDRAKNDVLITYHQISHGSFLEL